MSGDGREKRERLTYEEFGTAVRAPARAAADEGYRPDIVLSIA